MSLGKHKFYCEMCRKQCKDENAFQQHKRSSFHQQNMIQFNEDPEVFITRFSKEFQDKFIDGFRIKYGFSGYIPINKAYNEYIKDPYHVHLNSTRWTSLNDFAQSLSDQGQVEITKEPDMSGTEQILIRLIDKDRDKKAALEALNSKDNMRERERKREEKDIERMIKQANKMQALSEKKSNDEEIKGEAFHGEVVMKQGNVDNSGFKKQSIFGSSSATSNSDELLSLISKQKKSNLDRLLEHSTASKRPPVQQEIAKLTQWVRPKLIVKIKKEGQYFKQKGEVMKIYSPDRILVKISTDNKEREFSEKELSKVLPNEGGLVWIISLQKIASISQIDLSTSKVFCKWTDSEGHKDKFKVDLNDICKINS